MHQACKSVQFNGAFYANVIVDILKDLKLPVKDLIGKGFDGAANMSGKDEGVQRHLTEAGAEYSIYFHCFAHKLNLVLEQSVETVPSKRSSKQSGHLSVHGRVT